VALIRKFRGGCHPHDAKEATASKPIERFPPPETAVVITAQHIGAPAKVVVEKGRRLATGELIAEAAGFVSAPVHSPVTGVVEKIDFARHPTGRRVSAVFIKRDGEEQWAEGCAVPRDWRNMEPDSLRAAVTEGGIVGLGGASFPTAVKLSPPPGKNIDTVILNGVECEPYLTADHRLMLEHPEPIVEGLQIILRITGAERAFIAVEANKPDAASVMREATGSLGNVEVVVLPVRYPQGAEKQLIFAITGREVPAGGLPMDVGCLVQNVATSKAIADAVARSTPLVERVVTVTGDGVRRRGNFLVRVGTPVAELLAHCGLSENARRVILGGPMMGLAQASVDECFVTKSTSGILVTCDGKPEHWRACIRCGRCVRNCPMGLAPSLLSNLAEAERWDEADEAGVKNCIECGVCAFLCPAKRPMVEQFKLAKAMLARIWAEKEQESKKQQLIAEETLE